MLTSKVFVVGIELRTDRMSLLIVEIVKVWVSKCKK